MHLDITSKHNFYVFIYSSINSLKRNIFTTLPTVLAISFDSLVLTLQNTKHLIEEEEWVQTLTCVVSCRQFETHMLLVSSLGTAYTVLGVEIHYWILYTSLHVSRELSKRIFALN